MERRAFIGTLAGGLLTAPLAAEAQPPRFVRVWPHSAMSTGHTTQSSTARLPSCGSCS